MRLAERIVIQISTSIASSWGRMRAMHSCPTGSWVLDVVIEGAMDGSSRLLFLNVHLIWLASMFRTVAMTTYTAALWFKTAVNFLRLHRTGWPSASKWIDMTLTHLVCDIQRDIWWQVWTTQRLRAILLLASRFQFELCYQGRVVAVASLMWVTLGHIIVRIRSTLGCSVLLSTWTSRYIDACYMRVAVDVHLFARLLTTCTTRVSAHAKDIFGDHLSEVTHFQIVERNY